MSRSAVPLPCQLLRQINPSLCQKNEGCPEPLGQEGCFAQLFSEQRGVLGDILTTGYRLWEEKKGKTTRICIASPLFYQPLPDSDEAADPATLTAGIIAVKKAAREIRLLCRTNGTNGRNHHGFESGENEPVAPVTPKIFHGVESWRVEEDAKRQVGNKMLRE